MREFYMTIGLPGAGKTSWAKETMSHKCDWHSSDAIREELKTEDNAVVFKQMLKRTRKSLASGKDCIYDATNMSRKERSNALTIAKKMGACRTAILFLEPISVCKQRNANRQRKVPEFVYEKMLKRFDVPLLGAEFDRILLIQTEEPDAKETERCSEKNMDTFDQHNPHHTLTVGEHLRKTAELFEEKYGREYSDYVDEAARRHDIGKPYTFFMDEHGIGHFYGHEHVGAYMYLVSNYDAPHFWEHEYKTAVLINWHMRPYVWQKSEKARQRDLHVINDYDPDMYMQIMAISDCDRKAH